MKENMQSKQKQTAAESEPEEETRLLIVQELDDVSGGSIVTRGGRLLSDSLCKGNDGHCGRDGDHNPPG